VPEWYLLPFYAILRAITFDIGPIEAKLLGVIAMFGSILILFVVPWLDTSKVRSMRYRPLAQQAFVLFVVAAIGLGFCGANDPDKLVFSWSNNLVVNYVDTNGAAKVSQQFAAHADAAAFAANLPASAGASIAAQPEGFKWLWLSQILAAYYFLYFLVILPVLGLVEKPKPRPPSIAESVRSKKQAAPAATVSGASAPVAAE
jgi:ubiquinol-cytochrome c reductase cytochrome b subunit